MGKPPLHLLHEGLDRLPAVSFSPRDVAVRLDFNEGPSFLSPAERQQLAQRLAAVDLHRYPDANADILREVLAERLGCSRDELILTAGSDQGIDLLIKALGHPRDLSAPPWVVCPSPTFFMYRRIAATFGLRSVEVPLDDGWDLATGAMIDAFERHCPNLVFYSSPNNPTGNRFSEDRLLALVESEGRALHVIDEAYGPFAGAELAGRCERHPNVAVLGSLSKVGLAGVRLGWIRLHPDLRREVDKVRLPFNVSALSQAAAVLALTEFAPVLEEGVQRLVRERSRMFDALRASPGLVPYPSEANFILVRVSCSATALVEELVRQNIAICDLGSHGERLRGHVRITIGTPSENDRVLEALPRALAAAVAGRSHIRTLVASGEDRYKRPE